MCGQLDTTYQLNIPHGQPLEDTERKHLLHLIPGRSVIQYGVEATLCMVDIWTDELPGHYVLLVIVGSPVGTTEGLVFQRKKLRHKKSNRRGPYFLEKGNLAEKSNEAVNLPKSAP